MVNARRARWTAMNNLIAHDRERRAAQRGVDAAGDRGKRRARRVVPGQRVHHVSGTGRGGPARRPRGGADAGPGRVVVDRGEDAPARAHPVPQRDHVRTRRSPWTLMSGRDARVRSFAGRSGGGASDHPAARAHGADAPLGRGARGPRRERAGARAGAADPGARAGRRVARRAGRPRGRVHGRARHPARGDRRQLARRPRGAPARAGAAGAGVRADPGRVVGPLRPTARTGAGCGRRWRRCSSTPRS